MNRREAQLSRCEQCSKMSKESYYTVILGTPKFVCEECKQLLKEVI